MSSKSMSQIFKILFQTGDINTFVLRGVFLVDYTENVNGDVPLTAGNM